MQSVIALILLFFSLPLLGIFYLLVKLTSKGPFIFKQKRMGKDQKIFTLYKIRTMVENAEKIKNRYYFLNQADGPVFKIDNDPRLTKIGRWLNKTGFDELPQLINIIKGEMDFVGPRPLPVDEAKAVIKQNNNYKKRFSVKPGIFSSWVANGAFHNNFKKWMELDLIDIEKKSFWHDLEIIARSIFFIFKLIIKNILYTHR